MPCRGIFDLTGHLWDFLKGLGVRPSGEALGLYLQGVRVFGVKVYGSFLLCAQAQAAWYVLCMGLTRFLVSTFLNMRSPVLKGIWVWGFWVWSLEVLGFGARGLSRTLDVRTLNPTAAKPTGPCQKNSHRSLYPKP